MILKYKLTNETITIQGIVLSRIKALKNIGVSVKNGDLGGFVESTNNLSQYGEAWIADNAWVYGNAKVYENATVYGEACVSGSPIIRGSAFVGGSSCVYGAAIIEGDSCINSVYIPSQAKLNATRSALHATLDKLYEKLEEHRQGLVDLDITDLYENIELAQEELTETYAKLGE